MTTILEILNANLVGKTLTRCGRNILDPQKIKKVEEGDRRGQFCIILENGAAFFVEEDTIIEVE